MAENNDVGRKAVFTSTNALSASLTIMWALVVFSIGLTIVWRDNLVPPLIALVFSFVSYGVGSIVRRLHLANASRMRLAASFSVLLAFAMMTVLWATPYVFYPRDTGFSSSEGSRFWTGVRLRAAPSGPIERVEANGLMVRKCLRCSDLVTIKEKPMRFTVRVVSPTERIAADYEVSATMLLKGSGRELAWIALHEQDPQAALEAEAKQLMERCLAKIHSEGEAAPLLIPSEAFSAFQISCDSIDFGPADIRTIKLSRVSDFYDFDDGTEDASDCRPI